MKELVTERRSNIAPTSSFDAAIDDPVADRDGLIGLLVIVMEYFGRLFGRGMSDDVQRHVEEMCEGIHARSEERVAALQQLDTDLNDLETDRRTLRLQVNQQGDSVSRASTLLAGLDELCGKRESILRENTEQIETAIEGAN